MNINIVFTVLFSILIPFFFSACSDNAKDDVNTSITAVENIIEDNTTINVINNIAMPSKYYGKWTYVHSGEDIDIISTTDLNITEVEDDENLLEVKADNTTYYIVRSRSLSD